MDQIKLGSTKSFQDGQDIIIIIIIIIGFNGQDMFGIVNWVSKLKTKKNKKNKKYIYIYIYIYIM
jgi:hypothetical protein